MELEETKVYNGDEFESALIEKTIAEVALILEERGYNPINQIVGYLMSGDPGYISSHKEARKKIMKFDKAKILESMVRKYLNK